MVAGRVPRSTLKSSLRDVESFLHGSTLTDRLESAINPFHLLWAGRSGGNQSALLADLELRAAELRELIRLESEDGAAAQCASLRASLLDAGCCVERAKEALHNIGWTSQDNSTLQQQLADQRLIRSERSRHAWERVAGGLLCVGLAMVAMNWSFRLGRDGTMSNDLF